METKPDFTRLRRTVIPRWQTIPHTDAHLHMCPFCFAAVPRRYREDHVEWHHQTNENIAAQRQADLEEIGGRSGSRTPAQVGTT